MAKPAAAPRRKRPSSRFLIYKNPNSDSWRLDMSAPVPDPEQPTGHAYTATLLRREEGDGRKTYFGEVRALNSITLQRDIALSVVECFGTIRGLSERRIWLDWV